MSSYKKNYLSGFVKPFDSSKRGAFDRIINNINDAIEGHSLTITAKKRFKAVVVSGFGIDSFTGAANSGRANCPALIDMGDGIPRWKLRFAVHPELYGTSIAESFTAMYGASPLLSGISDSEMQYRISNMPFAYTDISNSNYSSIHFGSIVNITIRHGNYFITSTFGDALTTRPGGGPSGDGGIDLGGKQYKLDATEYDSSVENLPKGYWREILHNVVAEDWDEDDVKRKTCKSGKTYADFCRYVDGGNVGIAHFANRSLNNLLARMIREPPNGYGKAKVEKWFGKKVEELKQVFPTCYMPYKGKQKKGTNNCAKKWKWYRDGWNAFVGEYEKGGEARKLMIKIQDDTYRDTKVKEAEKIAKSQGYPTNMRNMAIILGVINSYGGWGHFRGLDPENALKKYLQLKPGNSHREGRRDLINKHYPIKKPAKTEDFKKKKKEE